MQTPAGRHRTYEGTPVPHSHPEHWKRLPGPHGWFKLWHPPQWTPKQSGEWAAVHLPDDGGVLTVCSFWLDESQAKPVSKVLDLPLLFPKRRKVQKLRELPTGDESLGFEGEAPLPQDGSWWQKVFQRQQWQRFRVWCVRRGFVYVLALYQPMGDRDPEAETLAALVLRSLKFAKNLPCPPEVFSRRVVELAQARFPKVKCESVGNFELQLGHSRLNLANFYRVYSKAPNRFEEILVPALTTIVRMQRRSFKESELTLANVRTRIMPLLCSAEHWREHYPTAVGHEWVGGLAVLYVVDEKNAYWHVPEELLTQWSISEDELDGIARENLDRYFDEQPMEFTLVGDEEEGPRLLLPVKSDLYNTSRLLSEQFHGKLRNLLGSQFAVGVPCRDFFVGVSLNSPETLEHVRKKVGEDFQQLDDPLSDKLLLVTHDGVTEYFPWI